MSLTHPLDYFDQLILCTFLYLNPQGALTPLWAGTSLETANLNGEINPSGHFSTTNETHPVGCSISSHVPGLASPAATTQSLGENFGLGSKSGWRMTNHFRSLLCYMHAHSNPKSLLFLKWRSLQKEVYRDTSRFIQMKGNGAYKCPFSASSLFILCPSGQCPVGGPRGN